MNLLWLVCRKCGTKEAIQATTKFCGCPMCGAERYAEDENGRPMVVWSAVQHLADFSPSR